MGKWLMILGAVVVLVVGGGIAAVMIGGPDLIYPRVPGTSYGPSSIAFLDTDGGPTIGGTNELGRAADRRPGLSYALPHALNRDSGGAPFENVLVIGAGSGNDVSRVLQWGAKHIDAVESFIDYRVPPEMFTALAEFDGSVIVERTAGEVSARCHDEQANFLALNLMHDIVSGAKTVEEAREYYAKEFLDHRRKKPTPYMDSLRFTTGDDSRSRDPDAPMFSDDELKRAEAEGKRAA